MNLEELTDCVYDYGCECISTTTKVIMDNVAICIRDAVLAEREACAKLCESMILQSATRAEAHSQAQGNGVAIDCANAIRARK